MTRRFRAPFALLLLSATLAMTGERAGPSDLVESCEPSAGIDIHAKTVSLIREGTTAKVIVEVTVVADRALASARIRGLVEARHRPRRAFGSPEVIDSVPAKAVRRWRYALELEQGLEHHIYVTAHARTHAGSLDEATAYLRVNLDPKLEPEVRGELLQFRARMEGK